MLIAIRVTRKDFTETWRVTNLFQETDDAGNPIGPTEDQLFQDLQLGLTEQENIRAFEIWGSRVVKVHKTFAEDLDPTKFIERAEKLFGTSKDTILDSELTD